MEDLVVPDTLLINLVNYDIQFSVHSPILISSVVRCLRVAMELLSLVA